MHSGLVSSPYIWLIGLAYGEYAANPGPCTAGWLQMAPPTTLLLLYLVNSKALNKEHSDP